MPSGVRQPLPIDVSASTEDDGEWVLANASTTIGLIRVPEGTGRDGVPISRTEDLKGVFWYEGD